MFCFASFPIEEDIRFIDTAIVNEKAYKGVVVDSTSKYPLENETLSEYRARLKKQLNISSSKEAKYPLGVKVFFILLILFVIILMIALVFSDSSSSRSSSNTTYTLDDFFPDP